MKNKHNLVGLSRTELATEMAELGEKPFRAKQLWHWIYHRGQPDFAETDQAFTAWSITKT